ncbi:hypothetical protein M758_UG153400 [Ceratodon purpureus]|nr:hypothetical protein M758_UG153400 [Ceratodon purpureus]
MKRERLKRTHSGKPKAPSRYTEKEWEAMKKNWDTPHLNCSQRKCRNSKKGCVQSACRTAWLCRSTSQTGLTNIAEEIKTSQDNPSSAAETNRKLEDVMKSNLDLQSMLKTVITTLKGTEVKVGQTARGKEKSVLHEASLSASSHEKKTATILGHEDCREQWWERLCKTSDEDEGEREI